MNKKQIKIINRIFILLVVVTFILAGVWYYLNSLQWQNDDPQIGYAVGFITLCYFGFFILVGECVLWRNIVYFASTPNHIAIEKIGRISLIILTLPELIGAAYALLGAEAISLELFDILSIGMIWISVLQILCQSIIGVAKRSPRHKQTAKN